MNKVMELKIKNRVREASPSGEALRAKRSNLEAYIISFSRSC